MSEIKGKYFWMILTIQKKKTQPNKKKRHKNHHSVHMGEILSKLQMSILSCLKCETFTEANLHFCKVLVHTVFVYNL